MVETRRGMRKKKEEISNPEASKAVEEASAKNTVEEEASAPNPAVEEANATNPTVEEGDEEREALNPALDEVGEQISASIPPLDEVIKDREDGEAAIAAVLDSLRSQEDVRESPEELASVGEGERAAESVRVAPEENSEKESADKSVSLNSKNTEDEDGGDGSGSKSMEASNREDGDGEKLDPEESMEEEEEQEEGEGEEEEEEQEGEQEEEEQREQEEDEREDREQQVPNDPDEEAAMLPSGLYFPPSEYQKKIKISTRCRIYETVKYLKEGLEHQLNKRELDWFEKHPQFKHIFHMKRDPTHKVMAMWMLLLRTARIEKKKEVWFVVNGIPIRYSIREHALISGLDCRLYPLNYNDAGSDRFKKKYFKGKKKITIEDVRKELDVMVPDRTDDRLKMAVLYFLCTVMVGQTKNSGKQASGVDNFCLKAVDDLIFCTNFPWGRYSFEYMLRSVSHTMSHFGGVVKGKNHPVPGFCIPLELLAFEAIPQLGKEFVEANPDASDNCPRMCRRQFKKISMTGWPLETIYAALGTTKEINSIITPCLGEHYLLQGLMEEGVEDDNYDAVVDSWLRRICRNLTVYFDELYEQDVDSRAVQHHENVEVDDEQPRIDTIELVDLMKDLKEDFQKQMEKMKEEMQTQMDTMKEEMQSQVDVLQTQVDILQMQLDDQKEPSKATASTSEAAGGGSKKKNRKRERERKRDKDGSTKKSRQSKRNAD